MTGIALLLLSAVAAAQQTRTFHVYVDPIHGDDGAALTNNPSAKTPGAVRPLDPHPSEPFAIQGRLQHAPYTFRTVDGAIQWVLEAFPGPLPWTHPEGFILRHIVIHCMPGLYGPHETEGEIDPDSGLPWNGEQFPITLPSRVSLQGTSALDTIFDARDERAGETVGSNLFVFDGSTYLDYDDVFIDSVTMRGCRYRVDGAASHFPGAAVVFSNGGAHPIRAAITNCFIVGNDVGIAIVDLGGSATHAPRIVANTFAWNHIGIFSTDFSRVVGSAEPALLNNVIDPIPPSGFTGGTPRWLQGIAALTTEGPSCFEGVDAADLGVTAPVTGNFNAYHSGLVNLGNVWPYSATKPRTATILPAPIVRLETVVHDNAPRGDLFIADVFRSAGKPCAPHDLRLAPIVRQSAAVGGSLVANPVVNQGISVPSAGTITFANGEQVATGTPGFAADGDAEFTAWDWDCEGFGNPREARRRQGGGNSPPFFPEPHGNAGIVDLGADEMGELIVSGYVDGTRIFSRPHAAVVSETAGLDYCETLYFFNVGPGFTYVSPQFNQRTDSGPLLTDSPDATALWYDQLGPERNPFTNESLPRAYTDGYPGSVHVNPFSRWDLATDIFRATAPPAPPAPVYPDFPRTRVCDIGPHLPPDINPFATPRLVDYAEYDFQEVTTGLPFVNDIFQVNSWYSMTESALFPATNDSEGLYVDFPNERLQAGTLNPPLTVANDPINVNHPLTFLYRDTGDHQIGVWLPSPYTYTVDATGRSVGATVPYIPTIDFYGIRVNFELVDPGSESWEPLGDPVNNLQTFLIVQGENYDPVPPGTAGFTSSGTSPSAPPTTPLTDHAGQRSSDLEDAVRTLRSLSRQQP